MSSNEVDFEEIELAFAKLLLAANGALTVHERNEVQRFIEVGEYGIALETMTHIYAEERKVASSEVVFLIMRLAEMMSLDAIPLIERVSSV